MTEANDDAYCSHCRSWREMGCKFGCPQKQPPNPGSVRSYEHWATEQKEQHAVTHEACMRPWSKHICPEGSHR